MEVHELERNLEKEIVMKGIELEEKCVQDLQGQTFTIDEAIERAGYGKFQIRLTCLAGLGWFADAGEVFILSIIGDYLACDWRLKSWQLALLTSLIFTSVIVGAPVFGYVADKYGRKISLSASLSLVFIFGALSAASPSYEWLVALRVLTGFALAGSSQGITLCSEYCPPSVRGRSLFYLCYFWSFGSMGIILLSWAVMQSLGSWRILLALTALPALMVIASLKWYPESPRYCLVSKQYSKATKLLQRVAEMNGSNLPFGKLQELNEDVERGRFRDLFSKEYRKTTLLFWCIWLGIASTYYGIIFLTPTIIQKGGLMIEVNSNNVSGNAIYSYNVSEKNQREIDDVLKCTKLSNGNFFDLLWTSSAELPGVLIFTFLVDCCSRKLLFGGSCIITALLTVLLLLDLEKIFLLIILFGARGILSANFQLVAIMTSEVFPTTIRAVAVGSGYAVCRLGCLTVPFLVQVLIASNPIPVISTLAILLFVCAVAVAFLPETKGAGLKESAQLQPKSKD